MTKYEIRKGDDRPCKLVSITPTGFGGYAENFVCSGTYTYCSEIMDKLENMT